MFRAIIVSLVLMAMTTSVASAGKIAPSSKGLPHAVSTANRAWAWFNTPAVQCETNHEGSWTTNTGIYRGKFQMDYSFQTSTPYGVKLTARYGLASNWPRIAQVVHAYTKWLRLGFNPWPPYNKFCYGKWPMSPRNWRR